MRAPSRSARREGRPAVPSQRLTIPGALGHPLAALLDRPRGPVAAYCVLAHAFGASKDLRSYGWMARVLARARIGVLRFDFTGLGESGGRFPETTFTSNVRDLQCVVSFLRERYAAPRILVGHSLGGAAALVGAREVPEARGVATIGAPSDTRYLARRLLEDAPALERSPEAEIEIAGKRVHVGRALLEDLQRQDLARAVGRLGKALLVFHSPRDEFVDIEHAERLFDAAEQPKSFFCLDGADHLLLESQASARFVGSVLAAWLKHDLGLC